MPLSDTNPYLSRPHCLSAAPLTVWPPAVIRDWPAPLAAWPGLAACASPGSPLPAAGGFSSSHKTYRLVPGLVVRFHMLDCDHSFSVVR